MLFASTKSAPRRSGDVLALDVLAVVIAASTKSAPRRSGDLQEKRVDIGSVYEASTKSAPRRSGDGAEKPVGLRGVGLNEVRSTKERRLQAEKLPPDKGLYRVLREVSLETRHWTIMFFRKVHTM